jgi:fructan beta-fructosidase
LIFNISQQATTENTPSLEYSYDVNTHVLTVNLTDGTTCPFLYILIDETTKPIRVSKDDEHFWNDIRVQRDNSTYKHNYEIGIKTEGVEELKFNLSKEYSFSKDGKDKEDEEYLLTLTAAQVENWVSFKKMHCNETNYWEYEQNRDLEDKYRPGYHHTPFIGWMNDPNGLVYEEIENEGYYHLFYQFNPYSSWWDNMHWGHSKSKDLLHWDHRPPAFYRFIKGHIFSGSVAYNNNNNSLIAYFTVWRKYGYDGKIFEFQHNYAGCSLSNYTNKTDYYEIFQYNENLGRYGKQFNSSNGNDVNPILIPEEEREYYNNTNGTFDSYLKSSYFFNNYRDPKFVKYKDDANTTTSEKNILLISADIEYRIYENKNKDFLTWEFVGKFGEDYGVNKKYMQYECPDIARIFPSGSQHAKWVFIANINPGGPFGGSATEYFTGDFDGATYTSDHVFPKWMDFGKDHYATVTYTNIPNEERVLALPWTSNWIYGKIVPTFQYRSTNGLPREFTLFKTNGEYFLNVAPSREVKSLRETEAPTNNFTVSVSKKKKKVNNGLLSITNGMLELNIDVTVTGNAKKYGFTFYNNESGEKVDFFFDTKKDKLWNQYGLSNSGSFIMDRRYSGNQNFLSFGEQSWGTHGREKKLFEDDDSKVYAYSKNCYKYVDPFRLGTKIPMALLKNQKKHNVQVFYDKSHIEVFLDGGRAVMTNIVFPNDGKYYNSLKFYTDKGNVNFEVNAYQLKSTLTNP